MNSRKRFCADLITAVSERLWLTIRQPSWQVACELLELDPAIDVVARAGKGGEAIETVMKTKPDMVLMDVNMPYLNGLTLAWFFTHRFPSARVVLMSTDESPELRKACEEAGAFDFVHKENFRQEFGMVMQRLCADS
jgi:DNA-binding NarL/FixJ family response regulator